MAFLSLLDDRARPKGSRDPLGFEMVWSHFGRKVVGNLTTITSSLDNFATALAGFSWAHEVSADVSKSERHRHVRERFLMYEQLSAYLRGLGGDKGIMGITRVMRRLEDCRNSTSEIVLGPEQQILSDQASYGLWGLYSTALRDTELVMGEHRTPTEKGGEIAEIVRARNGVWGWMEDVLRRQRPVVTVKELEKHAKDFIKTIRNPAVQSDLKTAVLSGNARLPLQQRLWEITETIDPLILQSCDIPKYIQAVIHKLNGLGTENPQYAKLAKHLKDIAGLERLLVAANNLFHYCRRKDGENFDEIVANIDDRDYTYTHLEQTEYVPLSDGRHGRGQVLRELLKALRGNDHCKALRLILNLNRDVMNQRGGAPWVELENSKTLRVRVKSERADLCDKSHLETHWDYCYFLGSFLNIAKTASARSVN